MAIIEKDLGAVSAYAIAVEHGYEGTEEEYAAQIAEAGSNAKLAAEAAKTAKEAAETAQAAEERIEAAASELVENAASQINQLTESSLEAITAAENTALENINQQLGGVGVWVSDEGLLSIYQKE